MAEEELVDNLVEDLGKGVEDESAAAENEGELSEKEQEEVLKEAEEIKKSFKGLTKDLKRFKELILNPKEGIQVLSVFITKNIAIGAIFYFVSFGLSRLIKAMKGNSEKEKEEKKKFENTNDILRAIKKLINAEICLSKKFHDWLDTKKGEMIKLEEIDVPLSSIFVTPFKSLGEALNQSYKAAAELVDKKEGKVSWKMPTKHDFETVIATSDVVFKSFTSLKEFVEQHAIKISILSTLDEILSDEQFAQLKNNLADVKMKLNKI